MLSTSRAARSVHRPRVGDVVALDQVAKQDGVEVLLMNLDSQGAAEPGYFGEAARFPVLVEGVTHAPATPWSTVRPRS